MEKCWGLGSGKVGGELAPQRFGVTGGREAGLGTEWGGGQSPVPGERLGARAGGESNVGWALLLPGLAGTCSTAFSGSKLHILFIFCAKRSCSEAIMGMFLSNVVFPLQASGTVTFLYILVTMSRTACCLHTGELCLGSPNFAHPGGSGAFSPSPGLTLYRCSRARGAGLLQGSRAGWGPPGGPRRSPRGVLAQAGRVPSTQHFWWGLAAAGTSSRTGQWSWGGAEGKSSTVGFLWSSSVVLRGCGNASVALGVAVHRIVRKLVFFLKNKLFLSHS